MKPEKVLAVTVAQGLVDYFKIFNNPHASRADLDKSMSEATLVLAEAIGVISMVLNDKETKGLLDVIREYVLVFRKDKLNEMRIDKEKNGVH